MSRSVEPIKGAVTDLWRYSVKSMLGEPLTTAQVTERGVVGDRAYALIDTEDGKVASAKNPGKWPTLFACRATYLEPPRSESPLPPVRIRLHDGTAVTSTQGDCNGTLSKVLGRQVTLAATAYGQLSGIPSSLSASWSAKAEEYWPDVEGLDYRNAVTDFALPPGTFFDSATIHLVTTATLSRLHDLYPQGRFEVPRFRPNIVLDASEAEQAFPEEAWIGHTIAVGEQVRLHITMACGRCVMTTLAQGDLPKDTGILRTAVQHNHGHVGVYASVVRGGTMKRGDAVRFAD